MCKWIIRRGMSLRSRQVEMADAPSAIGDQALSKTPSHFVTSDHDDGDLHLRSKRDREDVFGDGSEHLLLHQDDVDDQDEDDGVKKQKLSASLGDSLDDDLLDDLKPSSLG